MRKKGEKISRGAALLKMGSVAAGIPFIKSAINNMGKDYQNSKKIKALNNPLLAKAISDLEYLTPADKFIVQRRGNPVLSEIPQEQLASIGLTPETWKLEIVADPESNSGIEKSFSKQNGNPFTWNDLMKISESHSVKYLHALTCTNSPRLYGMGLWEGVPLREIFWQTKPKQNIRRIYFSGYHNNDEKQDFKSSLHISRVLEEAPGELPVMLCYKLNGKPISHANGGPVRLFVPGYYSNRSIKWLQRIVVTNSYHANDTYAEANNDVEGPVKTYAKFIKTPSQVKPGEQFAITGYAQVGSSGLGKVQYALIPSGKLPGNDTYLDSLAWHDSIILPPPEKWGSDLQEGLLPEGVMQIDPETGKPHTWPVINTIVHWTALIKAESEGEFEIRCRTVDANGIAQPMPRPFGRSGYNRIDVARIKTEQT